MEGFESPSVSCRFWCTSQSSFMLNICLLSSSSLMQSFTSSYSIPKKTIRSQVAGLLFWALWSSWGGSSHSIVHSRGCALLRGLCSSWGSSSYSIACCMECALLRELHNYWCNCNIECCLGCLLLRGFLQLEAAVATALYVVQTVCFWVVSVALEVAVNAALHVVQTVHCWGIFTTLKEALDTALHVLWSAHCWGVSGTIEATFSETAFIANLRTHSSVDSFALDAAVACAFFFTYGSYFLLLCYVVMFLICCFWRCRQPNWIT